MANKVAQPVMGQAVGSTYSGDANLLPWLLANGYVYDDTDKTSKLKNTSPVPASDPTHKLNREEPGDSFQWGTDSALAARIHKLYVQPGQDTRIKQLKAAGSEVVYVNGDNFTGATSVTFGGTAGTAFSVVNDKTIKVTTPAKAAGSYDVVVVKGAGNGTLTSGVTYV